MKLKKLLIALLIASSFSAQLTLMASTTEKSIVSEKASIPNKPNSKAYASQVLKLVNKERTSRGLKPVTLNTKLNQVAYAKSKDMSVNHYFSHTSPTYGSPFDMLKQFGVSYSRASENIARGYDSPSAVVKGWMNSSGHRQNILDPDVTQMGIGFYEKGQYWTQLFIRP